MHFSITAKLPQNNIWWITGGSGQKGLTKSTKFYNREDKGEFSSGPDLLVAHYGHCMVSLPGSGNKIVLIGGYHGRIEENMGISSDVWLYDFSDSFDVPKVKILNSLKVPRYRKIHRLYYLIFLKYNFLQNEAQLWNS